MMKREQNKTEGVNLEKQTVSSKRKYVKMILLVLVVAAIVAAGFFAWPRIAEKLNKPKPAAENAIEQYKQDLKDLKKQAATSGSKEDLQAYGIAQYATGDQTGAIETYKKQIEKEPNSIVAHSGLANALRDQKNFDGAIEEYKKVIEISPTDISAYVNLASVYQYQLKQMDKAVEVYKQGIEKNSKSDDLYVLLGLAYEQNGDNESAKAAYEKALELDENNAAAKPALERLNQ
ncbi:MAG: tetratricopeptide repeat protein [Candidatus Moranbacteria bacterium]|nr:tetratricopeptide repeat protein [Candidatus Moranbacteria bacterium]